MTTKETLDKFVGTPVIIENYVPYLSDTQDCDNYDTYKGILEKNGLGYQVTDGIHTILFASSYVNAFDKNNGIPTICI